VENDYYSLEEPEPEPETETEPGSGPETSTDDCTISYRPLNLILIYFYGRFGLFWSF